jgi:hypothetical protein
MQEFTKAKNLRLPSTGGYLLDHSVYREWKHRAPPRDHHNSTKDELDPTQTLVLKGKFGGKVMNRQTDIRTR